ncbi:MAG: hypothetical protein GY865_01930 [candidate division Zixibacteria bacterium]|nr:hypothetical protein [candidate division Zixibacteria bacterium]
MGVVYIQPYVVAYDDMNTSHDVPFNGVFSIHSSGWPPITGAGAIDENDNPIGTSSILRWDQFKWFFDPPCDWINDGLTHTVRFYVETYMGIFPSVHLSEPIHLTVTEGGAPEILEDYKSDILVLIGETEDVTIELDGPGNDGETWSYTVSDITSGDIFLDNGYFSFTPNEEDDGTIFLFTIRVTDCLGGIDEAKVYYWARSEVLCGDSNYDSRIDILDIVQLINILYKLNMNPGPLEINDVNNDGVVNILDIVTMINSEYKDGSELHCPAWE